MRLLLEKGAHVNCADADGSTALHIAANNNCTKVVQTLLEFGASPGDKTSNGHAPIHYAAGHGNLEMTVALVEAGANFRERGVKGGAVDIVTALVQSKKCKASASVIVGRLNTVEHRRNRRRESNQLAPAETPAVDAATLGEIAERHAQELLREVEDDKQRQAEKKEKERLRRKKAKLRKGEGAANGTAAPDDGAHVAASEAGTGDAGSEAGVAEADGSTVAGSKAVSVVDGPEWEERASAVGDRGSSMQHEADLDSLPEVDFDGWPTAGLHGMARDADSDGGWKSVPIRGASNAQHAQPPAAAPPPAPSAATSGKKKKTRKSKKTQEGKDNGVAGGDAQAGAISHMRQGMAPKGAFPVRQTSQPLAPAAQPGAPPQQPGKRKAAARAAVAEAAQHIPALHAGARPAQPSAPQTRAQSPLQLDEESFPELGAAPPPRPAHISRRNL